MKTKKWSRIPTEADILRFDGLHCATLYAQAVRDGWCCPCCGRSAHQLIRWSEIRGPLWRERYGDEHGMGFTIALARHHCHAGGFSNQKRSRFPLTLICGDCNQADGAVKRKLGLPEAWSFSPAEIARFVTVTPYSGRTVIDYAEAAGLYAVAHWDD